MASSRTCCTGGSGADTQSLVSRFGSPDPATFVEYKEGKHYYTAKDAVARIRTATSGVAAMEPTTVMAQFAKVAERMGDQVALKQERGDALQWQEWTWQQYLDETMQVARAFVFLGVPAFGSVNIMGFNAPEWHIANMAAIAVGAKAAGIYSTNKPPAVQYIAKHSGSSVAVVEDEAQLEKFLAIRDSLPDLKAIVLYKGQVPAKAKAPHRVTVYSWKELKQLGKKKGLQAEVDKRIQATKPGHCCTLIYTSGTTGNPKAVMISHDNMSWTANATIGILPPNPKPEEGEHFVGYLPLSHIAAQMLDIHLPMAYAANTGINCTLWFAQPSALKGTLKLTLLAARPTIFFGVPRVWEKFMEKMKAAGAQRTGLAASLVKWAKGKGLDAYERSQVGGGGGTPFMHGLANKLVLSKVPPKLGLDRCRMLMSGAAPISPVVLNFFGALGLPVHEVYGMSECTGPQTGNRFNYRKVGSTGPSLEGCEIRIEHDPERDADGEGEICYRGRHIMMGYMGDEAKSAAAIDKNGWLHSGDVGRIDGFGLLRITGRIKELIVTAGGENVAPVPIEKSLKKELPAISNAMVVGDKRKFLTVLFTLKTEVDLDKDMSTSQLTGEALSVSPESKTVEEAAKDKAWADYLQAGIERANKSAVSRASRVQKFAILPTDFSRPGGELTPTLKLRRKIVHEKYAKVIDGLYPKA